MFNRCKHEWVDEAAHFNPPYGAAFKARGPQGAEVGKMAMYGITNITQRCIHCGVINVLQVIGEVRLNGKS